MHNAHNSINDVTTLHTAFQSTASVSMIMLFDLTSNIQTVQGLRDQSQRTNKIPGFLNFNALYFFCRLNVRPSYQITILISVSFKTKNLQGIFLI